MFSIHGDVSARPAIPHPAYSRFIALLDVLGMKTWLSKDTAQSIAERLDVALVACDQSSMGMTSTGQVYGPLISTTHFSDTLLAWSPDDSWASLATLCSAVNMIVGVALVNGVPLRGAIAQGNVVCNKQTLRFVGQPIVDAHLWAEETNPYKSVGVSIVPTTLEALCARSSNDPIPAWWRETLNENVLSRIEEFSKELVWHKDNLYFNHWNHGMFLRQDPRAMFVRRQLPVNDEVEKKISDMYEFFCVGRSVNYRFNSVDPSLHIQEERSMLILDQIRLQRESVDNS